MAHQTETTSSGNKDAPAETARDRPLVSIIVAVFNAAKTLPRCIESVAEQTWPRKELIVMDGGSTDGTVEILKANSDKIAYWESKRDRGIYHAWNKALDRARGEWICFLGADDRYATPQSLERMVAPAVAGDFDLVSARGARVDESGQPRRVWGGKLEWERLKKEHGICHVGTLHHRRLFEKFGRFSEQYRITGDYEFTLRHGKTTKAAFVDEVTVCIGGEGVSRQQWLRASLEAIQIQGRCPQIGWSRALSRGIVLLSKIMLVKLLAPFGYERR